jgi:predicted small secreted protein
MLCLLLVFLIASVNSAVVTYGSGTTKTGHVTFYGAGADSGGTCMYNNPKAALANTLPTVAIGSFGNAEKCGACVLITPKGTGSGNSDFPTRAPFIAFVNNQCPECGDTNLDLAQSSDGVWDATWVYTECPTVGNIELQLKTGSSIYWTEISARNFKVALDKIEYNINGAWVALTRKSYNYFQYTTQVTLPVQCRLTSVCGEQKTITITAYDFIEPATKATSLQFASCGSTPTAPTAPVTPPTAPVTPPKAPTAPVTPPTAPVTPPKAPTAPVTPPTSPTAPKPPTCTYTSNTNTWWVEFDTDKTGGVTSSVTCADNKNYACTQASWGTYQCQINGGTECKAPRRAIIGGTCCSLDAGSCGSAVVEETDSTSQNTNLPIGAIIGIVAGIVVVVVVLVVLVARKLRTPPMEHV